MAFRRVVTQPSRHILLALYKAGVRLHRPWKVPLWTWQLLPPGLRESLRDRVLGPGNEFAELLIASDPELRYLALREPNSFAIPATAVIFVHRLLRNQAPRRLLEMGSGRSTLLLAHYARQQANVCGKKVTVFSIDHDESWLEKTRSALVAADLGEYATLLHAPIKEQHFSDKNILAYAIPEGTFQDVRSCGGFDFVLIDGPPRTIGRLGSLPVVSDYLADEATILLDDMFRSTEQEFWKSWQAAYRSRLSCPQLLLSGRHGLAVGQWHGAARQEPCRELRPAL